MSLLHNWRVITAMRANSAFFFFLFFFPPSSAALCRRLGRVSKPPLFSLWLSGKEKEEKKKSVLLPHSHRKFIILLSVCWLKRFQEWKTMVSGVQCAVTPCMSWPPSLNLFSPFAHTHSLTLSDIPSRLWCLLRLVGIQSACLSMHVRLLIYSPCNLFIHTFCFLSIWSTVLEPGTCMLQQDVGFVLTRLISCRRRHRLIKIIPCYRGCFGQPNDTGGLLCSTDCSRSPNGAPRPRLAPN